MKRKFILSTAAVFAAVIFLTSCGPSRVYSNNRNPPPPPPSRSNFTLIISPSPGFAMSQSADGRYFHRSQQGMVYWKGYDNRFYLDRRDLRRVNYSKWEYNQWKKYSRYQNNNRSRGRY